MNATIMRNLTIFLITCNAFSQNLPPVARLYDPLPQVRIHLQLSSEQVSEIDRNNVSYNDWSLEKRLRVAEVRKEIAEETARENINAGALGIRYAEIESICRDMKDRAAKLRKDNIALLDDQQKARLAALEQVLSLMPVVIEAQNTSLLGGVRYVQAPATGTASTSSNNGSTGTGAQPPVITLPILYTGVTVESDCNAPPIVNIVPISRFGQ